MQLRRHLNTFDMFTYLFLSLLAIVTLYPFIYVLVYSLNDSVDSMRGGLTIWPRQFSLQNYVIIFEYPNLAQAFLMSVLRTVAGTLFSVLATAMLAYSLTKRDLVGYSFINMIFVLTLFLYGGLIPTFILYKNLEVYNTFWVYLLPGLISAFNMILIRTNIKQIPTSLIESAYIDGANEAYVFFKIIIPLSTPVIATISLFVAVGQWNAWDDTLFFTSGDRLQTLQYVLMKILSKQEASQMVNAMKANLARKGGLQVTPESIKMSITMVATLPILLVYPFVQKYFVKGMLLGSVKG